MSTSVQSISVSCLFVFLNRGREPGQQSDHASRGQPFVACGGLGCKGPVTYADCPTRMWNSGTNWCIGAGSPCHGCVEPDFPDRLSPLYRKIDEENLEQFRITDQAAT